MTATTYSPARSARLAGFFYLCIILFGVGGAMLIRGPMFDMSDVPGTVASIAEGATSFRLSILADLVMALADVALALVFFRLFRPVSKSLSLAAMVFRLVQASVLALNLVFLALAVSFAQQGDVALTMQLIGAHDVGYALALFFFAVSCLCLAAMLWEQSFLPRLFAPAMALTAVLYIAGSVVRVVFPEAGAHIAPIYGLCLLLELALCLWLLIRGVNATAWRRMSHD